MKIILASKSCARKKLLSQLGLRFEVKPAEIDEEKIRESSPSATVKKIALLKAKKIYHELKKGLRCSAAAYHLRNNDGREEKVKETKETVIIAADTMVYVSKSKGTSRKRTCSKQANQRSKFIGKPKDKNDAKRILTSLSGTTHWLYSGICVLHQFSHSGGVKAKTYLDFDKSKVAFRKLSEKEIDEYVANNPVHLWAGAYTIEKGPPDGRAGTAGASFIKEIKGSSSNVLGLPVKKLKKILSQIGLI